MFTQHMIVPKQPSSLHVLSMLMLLTPYLCGSQHMQWQWCHACARSFGHPRFILPEDKSTVTKKKRVQSTTEHLYNSTDPQTNQVSEVPPTIVTLDLLFPRSCTMLSLNALSAPHIHLVHTIFSITTLTIATKLAFHS